MTILNLICNHINFNKTKSFKFAGFDTTSGKINIWYNLVVPANEDDKEFIGNDTNREVEYRPNVKKQIPSYKVYVNNVDKPYPQKLTNNKVFKVWREYNIEDWLKHDFHIYTFLHEERTKIFAEIKANMVLKQIGELTKDWNDLTSGKMVVKEHKQNYAATRLKEEYLPF